MPFKTIAPFGVIAWKGPYSITEMQWSSGVLRAQPDHRNRMSRYSVISDNLGSGT
jgi:hypothetical protein